MSYSVWPGRPSHNPELTLRRAARGLPFALRPAVTPFANGRKRRALGLSARETRLVSGQHSVLLSVVISSKRRSRPKSGGPR